MPLSPVSLPGRYFLRGGKRFLPTGAHWVPAGAALDWPLRWDPASIEADFAKMKDLGFNTVRLDLFWAWFEPRPGVYNPEAFEQLDFLVKQAHRYEIYLHPALFIGGEVGEAYWDVPWRHGRHPHADPEMLRLQTEHAAELARRYKDEPAVLAWDLTDEPPYWIVSESTTDAMAVNWTRLIAGALRRCDPNTPLCVGTSMEDVAHGPFRPDIIAGEVDFFSAHPYSIYTLGLFPDPMLSERGTYCGTFQTLLSSGAGRPVMIHELGASAAQYAPERIAAFDRATMYSTLGAGANGFLLWCYADAAPDTFKRSPYKRAPHETQFGLTTWDRKDRPAGAALRRFSQVTARMDLDGLEPEPPAAGIIVPDEWAKPHGDFAHLGLEGATPIPYLSTQDGGAVAGQLLPDQGETNLWLEGAWLSALILARRAGLAAAFPREYSNWQQYPMLIVPSPLTSTERNLAHVHTTFWEAARQYVEQGGALYLSLCADAAIPEMEDWMGARLADHYPVERAELRVVAEFGDLKERELFLYNPDPSNPKHWPALINVSGGQVIAVDGAGHPALVVNEYGRGKVMLSAYPLESYLAVKPGAFEQPEYSYRLYRAFRQWAGVRSLFETDQPSVEVAALSSKQRGYAVVTSHLPVEARVQVSTKLPIRAARLLTPDGTVDLGVQERAWQMTVPAFDGMVVEWTLAKHFAPGV